MCIHLFVMIIPPESENGNHVGALLNGQVDEAITLRAQMDNKTSSKY
jgi:hypothetical protein